MTVKTDHGEFECADLTFKDRRVLHRLEVQAIDSDGVFQIQAPKMLIDTASINFDDDGWKTVIPFRCTYDAAATSNTVVSIATAA